MGISYVITSQKDSVGMTYVLTFVFSPAHINENVILIYVFVFVISLMIKIFHVKNCLQEYVLPYVKKEMTFFPKR